MPPSQLRGRHTRTTYVYDDQGRIAATYTRSPWTTEDRLLLLAYASFKQTLCPGCGQPKKTAWHPDNEGFFEVVEEIVCHACTAIENHGVEPEHHTTRPHLVVQDTRDYTERPLPPLDVN